MPATERDLRSKVMHLALTHRARLIGYLLVLAKDPDKAEDLFQSTCVVICEKCRGFAPGTNFLAWAFQIARYEFLNSVDPRRHRLVLLEAEALESVLLDARSRTRAEPAESDSSRREQLRHCLDGLPRRTREAFDLRYARSFAPQQICKRLGLTLNALYALFSRTRKGLKECIERRTHQASAGGGA